VALKKLTFGARFTLKGLDFASYPNAQKLFEITSEDEDVRLEFANAKTNRQIVIDNRYIVRFALFVYIGRTWTKNVWRQGKKNVSCKFKKLNRNLNKKILL
jgi:hypothetical protein